MKSIKIVINDNQDHSMEIGYYCGKDLIRHNRDNLPAIVIRNGSLGYFYNGKPHRTNGPSMIFIKFNSIENPNLLFHIHGKSYNELDYWREVNENNY